MQLTEECATLTLECGCSSSQGLHIMANQWSIIAEDDLVQDFLWIDSCAKVADKVSPPVCMA